MIDSPDRTAIRKHLFKWFDGLDRPLPWLERRNPYKVWVSEIMLQQTQIATVVGYYNRFIKRFPNVKKLAAVELDDVLSLWEGLGYYRRARQLHKAARMIVELHDGRFPTDFDQVLSLPGIGRYTAGAILSIALEQRHPILEGNTVRLFSRLIGMQQDAFQGGSQAMLWKVSEALLPRKRVGDFNQALMDFGREVCTAKTPKCESCCIRNYCKARIQGRQHEIPHRARKIKYEELNESIVLVKRRNKYLVRQCGEGERWNGLWDFPRVAGHQPQKIAGAIQDKTGLSVELESLEHSIRHAVTRFRIKLDCFRAKSVVGRLTSKSDFIWKTVEEIEALPMNVTGRKFAKKFLQ